MVKQCLSHTQGTRCTAALPWSRPNSTPALPAKVVMLHRAVRQGSSQSRAWRRGYINGAACSWGVCWYRQARNRVKNGGHRGRKGACRTGVQCLIASGTGGRAAGHAHVHTHGRCPPQGGEGALLSLPNRQGVRSQRGWVAQLKGERRGGAYRAAAPLRIRGLTARRNGNN